MGKFPPRAPWVYAPDRAYRPRWDAPLKSGEDIMAESDRESRRATRRVGLLLVALYIAVCLLLTL